MKKQIITNDIPVIKELIKGILGHDSYNDLQRMGGLTNHTYKVVLPDGKIYVIRIPGEGTEYLINRSDEKVSTLLACKLNIDTELLHFGEDGTKVSLYIEDAQTMSACSMRSLEHIKQAADIFRTLHTCGVDTKVAFDVFDMAANYEAFLINNNVDLYEDYPQVKEQVMIIRKEIKSQQNIPLVPCHNDPLCENWIEGNNRLYLIDWEYAGMNDGMWDLADLSIEADYSKEQDEVLLNTYFGRNATADERKRLLGNKIYLDYLWTLWGKTRVPYDGEPMQLYAYERYIRLKNNLKKYTNNLEEK